MPVHCPTNVGAATAQRSNRGLHPLEAVDVVVGARLVVPSVGNVQRAPKPGDVGSVGDARERSHKQLLEVCGCRVARQPPRIEVAPDVALPPERDELPRVRGVQADSGTTLDSMYVISTDTKTRARHTRACVRDVVWG